MLNNPTAIDLAKQILDPTSCDELNYREFCADAAPELAQALLASKARCEALETVLRLVLPMAKGYSALHRVGSNAVYIAQADDVLAPCSADGKGG